MSDPARDTLVTYLLDRMRSGAVRLPPYPAIALALERLRSRGSSIGEIAELVASDASLAAVVLRRASSAATSTARGPLTIEQAIWRLGFEELNQLVFATTLGGTTLRSGPLATLRRDAWRRSLLSASLSKELATSRRLPSDAAFLGGLLHGFGSIVAIACAETMGRDIPVVGESVWSSVFDEVEQTFAAALAQQWNLPAPVVDTIAQHKHPETCTTDNRAVVQLVATANSAIARLERAGASSTATALDDTDIPQKERRMVRATLARAAERMAAIEMPAHAEHASTLTTVIERIDITPIDVKVTSKSGSEYHCTAIGDEALVFSGPALPAGWIAELVFDRPRPTPVLVNVRSCVPAPKQTYAIIARPFALDDDARAAWAALAA